VVVGVRVVDGPLTVGWRVGGRCRWLPGGWFGGGLVGGGGAWRVFVCVRVRLAGCWACWSAGSVGGRGGWAGARGRLAVGRGWRAVGWWSALRVGSVGGNGRLGRCGAWGGRLGGSWVGRSVVGGRWALRGAQALLRRSLRFA